MAAAADDEDCENEGDSAPVVLKVMLVNAGPTTCYISGATRALTWGEDSDCSYSFLTITANEDCKGMVHVASADVCEGTIIGTLVVDCVCMTKISADLVIEFRETI